MYKIFLMKKEEISQVMNIWHNQYEKYCSRDLFPNFWDGGREKIESFLSQQIERGNAIVAKKDEEIVGFIAWIYADFHNEKSAFCPIVGHAAVEENKEQVYRALYNYASQKWVKNNAFNHLWMIFYDDAVLKNILYDIGFGSYVKDVFQKTSKANLQVNCSYRVLKAVPEDVDLLFPLVEESRLYFINTPIFLKRDVYTKEMFKSFVEQNIVFVAWDKTLPIGFISLIKNKRYNIETLAVNGDGLIAGPGAYVKEEYRGKGIGKRLLQEVFEYSNNTSIPYLHISYETANPLANRFWPKYFVPVILSVRRSVNKDANT